LFPEDAKEEVGHSFTGQKRAKTQSENFEEMTDCWQSCKAVLCTSSLHSPSFILQTEKGNVFLQKLSFNPFHKELKLATT